MKSKQNSLFNFPITAEQQRIIDENLIYGKDRPKPNVGDTCMVFSEEQYHNCRVIHISKSGKTFWAETIDRKIFFRDISVSKFKPVSA